ncbi:MAG: O-antigen ligase family protein [Candidatus Paceibacterota bacterium]|jgi:O-antigen ligase
MDIKNIARWKIFVGIWALLLIPFYVANSMFFPYISGKNFAFRIIVEIIFAVWAYLAFIDKKYRPKFSWVAVSVALFVLIMAVANIFSIDPAKAFWSNFERMDGWITLIHLLMFLVVAGSVMKTEKIWLWFFRSSVVSSVAMATLVYQEWIKSHPDRSSVSLGNPIYVAIYFLFNFFFALILLYKDVIIKSEGSRQVKRIFKNSLTYIYSILAALCVWGIWMTSTRGVILGLIGGLIVSSVIIAIFEKKNKLMRNVAIGGLVTIVILIGGFFAIRDTQFAKENKTLSRFASLSWKDIRAGQGVARQYVWSMAIQGAKEKPILGWGQEGFNYVFNKYYDERMYDQEQWFDRAHNTPLDILIAGGTLGLVSYLGIFVAALWLIWKRRNKLGIIDSALLVGVLAGYFFQNLFVFDNLSSYILFFIVLAYLHASDTEEIEIPQKLKEGERMGISNDLANYVVLPILLVTLGMSVWYFNCKPIAANLNLIKAMGQQSGGVNKNLEYFQKAISYNSMANSEILEQLLNITPRVVSLDGVDMETKQDFINLASIQAEKQINETPDNARYQFFVGGFLSNMQQFELALPYLEKAVELSPKKISMLIELTNCLSSLGQKTEALGIAKRAYDLVPVYEEGKMNYVAALIRNGEEKKAKELLGGTTTNERVIRAYLLNAADFLKVNSKSFAVAEVQKAMKIAPEFEAQGKEVIDGIWAGTIK